MNRPLLYLITVKISKDLIKSSLSNWPKSNQAHVLYHVLEPIMQWANMLELKSINVFT